MQKHNKKVIGFNIVEVIIIIIVSAILTSIATGIIVMNNFKSDAGTSYSELLKDPKVKEFLDVYDSVLNGYYENVDKDEAINSAISGMMDYLGDKYSSYLNNNETNNLEDMLAGTYYGIGISLSGDCIIQEVFDNSPAKEASLQVGDKIIKVNDQIINDNEADKITSIIKEAKDSVNMVILRNNEEINITVKVKSLNKPAISYSINEFNNKKIGVLKIDTFSTTLAEQVKLVLDKFDSSDVKDVIIDLRNNGGGYLTAASSTASLFLEKGKVIYSLENKGTIDSVRDESDEHKNYNIAILVNEGTASAAEILTAALKDSYGATIIGKQTYGKGVVQQTKSLSDGTMVKYTTARWLRPNGECIDQVGIKVDFEESIEIIDNQTLVDNQFKKAIEVLSN